MLHWKLNEFVISEFETSGSLLSGNAVGNFAILSAVSSTVLSMFNCCRTFRDGSVQDKYLSWMSIVLDMELEPVTDI